MASNTELCNLAISKMGHGKTILNLETEKSTEANACRIFFETTRDAVLRDFNWPFAKQFIKPGLIAYDPLNGFAYAYQYPEDCIRAVRIANGIILNDLASTAPFERGRIPTIGQVIYCNINDALLEYTARIEDPTEFPADFQNALAFRLAFEIAPSILGGQATQTKKDMWSSYEFEIKRAKTNVANEQQSNVSGPSSYESSRI